MLNPRPIHLESGRDVNRYLDDWADGHLVGPERWADLLTVTRDWTDYSARNQILLAAHGALGPVAGIETWRLVPSGDHVCAVRAGEHGLPVRVPVTTAATQRDPHVGRARPTQSAVAGWEWRSVFCVEQLARRPDAEQLRRARPDTLTGPDAHERFLTAARAAAKTTVRGRMPMLDDPLTVLADAAVRLPRNDERPPLTDELAVQAAWLVADGVGLADGSAPAFDPIDLAPRQRWEVALDVLDPSRRLLAGLGKNLGLDLLESPLPRMFVDDDRVVSAARRNRLPRSTLEQLPLGTWVDVGPYTPDEWAARGETANGRGAYLRLNSTAYLVTAEHTDGAIWRLEDTRAKTGAGLLAEGVADTLEGAQATAMRTMTTRYPQLAEIPAPPPPRPSHDPQLTIGNAAEGWEPLPARPEAESRRRVLDHDVVIYVMPTGDAWAPMTQAGRSAMIEPAGDPVPTREEAMSVALFAGRRLARDAAAESRVDFDTTVARFAESPNYTRTMLVDLVSTRLDSPERIALASDPTPPQLASLLCDSGLTSATVVAVLHAEQLDPTTVAPILPTLAIPTSTSLRILTERWELDATAAAELVGATATDMRTAGCSPDEIIRARPRDVIEHLPADPHLWDLAGGTLATSGHDVNDIGGFLATHAPDPTCFASGITAAVDDPALGIAIAVRRGMPPEAVAATSERYGLSPAETATALGDAGASPHLAVPVLLERCEGDLTLTTQVARSALQMRNETVIEALTTIEPLDSADVTDLRAARPLSRDRDALIAANIPPRSAPVERSSNAALLLDSLPQPDAATGDATRSLLASIPDPEASTAPSVGSDLLAAIPDPEQPNRAPELEITP